MRTPIGKRQSAIRQSTIFNLQSSVSSRRSTLLTLVALVAVGGFLFLVVVPPRALTVGSSLSPDLTGRTIGGAYHVHTTRSDGIGDRDAVAAAAARAGLAFVILTDHGDGTRPPDPAVYLHGVLVLEGVEISTDEGHYVALDMRRAPYPLGGAAAAVVEDVARLGGFGIAAHPDSPKPGLRWTDDHSAIDGIEWLNADSEWRNEPGGRRLRAGIGYFLRPGPAIARSFDRPVTLNRWDRLTVAHAVVALAGADAHGGVGRRAEEPNRTLWSTVGIPSYQASFQAFSNRVLLDRPLAGDAALDARAVFSAIRQGRVFTAIDGLATPAVLDFHVEDAMAHVPMGSVAAADSDATIVARAAMPPGAELLLLRDGREVDRSADEIRRTVSDDHAAYRVEVRLPGVPGTPPIPWLVSNPIYFRATSAPQVPPVNSATAAVDDAIAPFPWRLEKDTSSSGILRTGEHSVDLEFRLANGARGNQFVALATDMQRQSFTAIDLSLAADRPSRISVQVRRADGTRCGRSVYVDSAGSRVRVALSDLRATTGSAGSAVSGIDVTSILLVVDLTNAAPGRAGKLRVLSSALVK